MQLQSISILILLFLYVHDHIHAVPVQQNEISPSENDNVTKGIKLPFVSRACSLSSDCYPHSQCVGGVCECVKEWATWKDGVPCSYEQKSQLAAFLLSFLLGNFGADWFYLARSNTGYIVAGIFKLLLACGCCSAIFGACSKGRDGISVCAGSISILMSCGGGIWWLVDWIRILTNKFPDGDGAPLYTW